MLNEQKTERVVVLLSPEEMTELEIAIKMAAKMRGQRGPKMSAFLRDVLLKWSDDVKKEAMQVQQSSNERQISMHI